MKTLITLAILAFSINGFSGTKGVKCSDTSNLGMWDSSQTPIARTIVKKPKGKQ